MRIQGIQTRWPAKSPIAWPTTRRGSFELSPLTVVRRVPREGHFEVSDGVQVVTRLPSVSYGALYQTLLVDRVIEHGKAGDVV